MMHKPLVTLAEVETKTGEEDESSVFDVRGKLLALSKGDDGEGPLSWRERGVGVLKVNVMKSDSSKCRLLMRTEGVNRVILNVGVFSGMTVSKDSAKAVKVLGIDGGKPTQYLVRVKEGKDADELVRVLEKQINVLK